MRKDSRRSGNDSDKPLIDNEESKSFVDIELGQIEGGAGKEDDVELLDESFTMGEGVYELHLDYTAVPDFNILGSSDADHGVGDIGGSIRFFIELSHAGHAKFDEKSWARMLHICRYEAFLSGEAVQQQEVIKDHINEYRKMRTAQKPWGNPELKSLKAHWHHHLPELKDILVCAIEEAASERETKQWPLRSIIFWGDILADRDSSCGDLPIIFAMYIAQKYNLPNIVMASNHGLRAIKLQQFLSALLGEKEDSNEQRSRWLDVFRSRQRENDEEVLTEEDINLAKKALAHALKSHAINPDRLVSYFKTNIKTDEERQSLKRLFNYMGSIPYDFLREQRDELKDTVKQLLGMMPIGASVIANVVAHNIAILSDTASPIGRYIMGVVEKKHGGLPEELHILLNINLSGDGKITPDVEAYIHKKILETRSSVAMQDLFGAQDFSSYQQDTTITDELNFAVTEDIRKELYATGSGRCSDCLNAVFVADRRDTQRSGSRRPLMNRLSIEEMSEIFSKTIVESGSAHSEQSRMSGATLEKTMADVENEMRQLLIREVSILGGREEELGSMPLQELLARFKWVKLNEYRLRVIRQFRVDQVKRLIAQCDFNWLPVDNEDFMQALVNVKNRDEVFTPIKTTQEQILLCAGSVLTQYLMFPDTYEPSATSLLAYVMPPLTANELDTEYEGSQSTLIVKGRCVSSLEQKPNEERAEFERRAGHHLDALKAKCDLPLMVAGTKQLLSPVTADDFEIRFLLEMAQFKIRNDIFRELYRSPVETLEAFRKRVDEQLALLVEGRAAVQRNPDITCFLSPEDLARLRNSSDEDQKVTSYILDGRVVMREFRLMGETAQKFQKRCSKIYKLLTNRGEHSSIKVSIEPFLGILTGKDLGLSIVPQIAQLHLLPRAIFSVQKRENEDRYDFNDRRKKELDAMKSSINTNMLTNDGAVSDSAKARFSELHEWYCAWRDNISLFSRSGLSGNYITHAPLVGIKGETTDQSMVLHYLIPSAQIFLKALKANKELEAESDLKDEAKSLFKKLTDTLKVIPRTQEEIIDSPVIHLKIWRLMQSINSVFQYFLRHELIVTEETYHIPKTHIGMLSRSSDSSTWENMIVSANRHNISMEMRRPGEPVVDLVMGQGVGSCMEKNPLLLFVYPLLAAVVWSRANKFEHMYYPGCQLIPLEKHTYGHMGEPESPFGQCIDTPPEGEQLKRYRKALAATPAKASETERLQFVKRYAVVQPLPLWAKSYLDARVNRRDSRDPMASFSGELKQDVLEEKHRASSLIQNRVGRSRSLIAPIPRLSSRSGPFLLREVWNNPEWFLPFVAKGILDITLSSKGQRPSKSRASTKATVHTEAKVLNEAPVFHINLNLKEELEKCVSQLLKCFRNGGDATISVYSVLFEYLSTVATDGRVIQGGLADKIHVVLNDMPHPEEMTKRARYAFNVRAALRLSRMPHSAKMAEFMLPFYALGELSINAMLRLEMFSFYRKPEDYSVSLSATAGADHFQDRVLHPAVISGAKQDRKRHLPILRTSIPQKVFGGIGVVTAVTSLLGQFFFVIALSNDNNATKEAIHKVFDPLVYSSMISVLLVLYIFIEVRDKFSTCFRPILDFFSRFFPRLSGVSRHPLLNLFYRPVIAYETFSVGFKWFLLCSGQALDPGNTSDESYPQSTDYLPYAYVMMSAAFSFALFASVLFVMHPSTNIAPGQQERREIHGKFEGNRSKHLQRALSFLQSFSWFEASLITVVGIYGILAVSDATTVNEAAVIGTAVMLAQLALRLGAYPPNCCLKACQNENQDPIADHHKKRVVRQISLVGATVLCAFFDFYLQGIFGACVAYYYDSNFDLFYFLKDALHDPDKTKVLIWTCVATGFQATDNVLSLGRYFLATGDLDKAKAIRELAESMTSAQESSEKKGLPEEAVRRSIVDMLRLRYIARVNAKRKVNPQAQSKLFGALEGQRGSYMKAYLS